MMICSQSRDEQQPICHNDRLLRSDGTESDACVAGKDVQFYVRDTHEWMDHLLYRYHVPGHGAYPDAPPVVCAAPNVQSESIEHKGSRFHRMPEQPWVRLGLLKRAPRRAWHQVQSLDHMRGFLEELVQEYRRQPGKQAQLKYRMATGRAFERLLGVRPSPRIGQSVAARPPRSADLFRSDVRILV